jgi:16S rRNA (guanine527-N7)-methyltransferase
MSEGAGLRLNALLAEAGIAQLNTAVAVGFEAYISLFVRWNSRINLSSVRDEEGILSRHLVESIAVVSALPADISTLLDFGSGGGLPGIPIALCRPEIAVTLAESQSKKAAFLQQAVRVLGLSARVHAGRAETLHELFDCVTMRAVDRMVEAVGAAGQLVAPAGGWLALMTTEKDVAGLQGAAGAGFSWRTSMHLPSGDDRVLALGKREVSSPV